MLTISVSYETITVVTGLFVALIAAYLICGHYYENRGRR